MPIRSMVRRLATISLAGVVMVTGLVLIEGAQPASAAPSADICDLGYVWREAVANDHVCVTPATRSQAAYDNSQAASRVDPTGPYGPDACIQGYVWREAIPTDHVCVTPDIRSQTAYDNSQAASRAIGAPIVLHTNVVFPDGVALGGYADLTLYGDGTYTFSGHFHDSGFVGYNTGFVWVVRSSTGTALTFSDTGHTQGTVDNIFGPNRDHDWSTSGYNASLQASWHDIQQGYSQKWEATESWDLNGLFNDIKAAIGYVSTVVSVVGAIF
jgi:hypothetical protein